MIGKTNPTLTLMTLMMLVMPTLQGDHAAM